MSEPSAPADRVDDVIVVGAGMAGIRAATLLAAQGRTVTVVDKGRRPGGRMATRRVDDATFDTGAVEFSSRTAELRSTLEQWEDSGVVRRLDVVADEGPTTWRGTPTMRALPDALASALDSASGRTRVLLSTQVTRLDVTPTGWRVAISRDGVDSFLTAAALILTPPAPQSYALLSAAAGTASQETLAQLRAVTYAPSLTVLVRPVDRGLGPAALPLVGPVGPGTVAPDLVRIHRNDATGASGVVALTLQADPTFSTAHLDGDRDVAASILAGQASNAVSLPLSVVHIHGWRYAQVAAGIDPQGGVPALIDTSSGRPLILAGDLFTAMPRAITDPSVALSIDGVERAFVSGTAAAELLS
jgi:renalase